MQETHSLTIHPSITINPQSCSTTSRKHLDSRRLLSNELTCDCPPSRRFRADDRQTGSYAGLWDQLPVSRQTRNYRYWSRVKTRQDRLATFPASSEGSYRWRIRPRIQRCSTGPSKRIRRVQSP